MIRVFNYKVITTGKTRRRGTGLWVVVVRGEETNGECISRGSKRVRVIDVVDVL